MDFQNRAGGRTGGGGMASAADAGVERRERLRQLALETIDLQKDPYFMRNHVGTYECKLCLTLHNNEGSYLAHTQGKKHQANLARRAAKDAADQPFLPALQQPKVDIKRFVKIGRPGYKVTRERDPHTGQLALLFQIDYPEAGDGVVPRHRFMSAYEQKIHPPEKKYQYLLFAAEPYETISFKIPSKEVDKAENKFWTLWNKETKQFFVQVAFRMETRGMDDGMPPIPPMPPMGLMTALSLADTLQYDDYSKAVEEGLTGLEFFRLIHAIRSEIKVLYDLTEAPSAIDSLDETRPFLYELSALLVELDCGQMQLLSGPLEDRFSSIANRQALVDFLLSELKTARLLEIERGKEPVKVVDTDVALALDSALAVLGAQRHQYPAKEAIDNVMRLGDSVLQNMSSRPTPLLHEKIDPILWGPIEQLCHRFAADLRARNLLLLKRIDVTVNSFLWLPVQMSVNVQNSVYDPLLKWALRKIAVAESKTLQLHHVRLSVANVEVMVTGEAVVAGIVASIAVAAEDAAMMIISRGVAVDTPDVVVAVAGAVAMDRRRIRPGMSTSNDMKKARGHNTIEVDISEAAGLPVDVAVVEKFDLPLTMGADSDSGSDDELKNFSKKELQEIERKRRRNKKKNTARKRADEVAKDSGISGTDTEEAEARAAIRREAEVAKEPELAVDIEYVGEAPVLDTSDPNYSYFNEIFNTFKIGGETAVKEEPVKDAFPIQTKRDETKAAITEKIFQEELATKKKEKGEEEKLSKKKLRLALQPSIASLKENTLRPDVVEWADVTSRDPHLLVAMKAYRNTVPVPRHWNAKRK
ncbi:unnamed protein product, partial [Mesorhabditis spiculigera]